MNKFYIGVVESRKNDPLKMGRVKVRVIGVHTDNKVDLPTDDLPWAMPMTPITSASMNGIGDAPVGLVEGSYVVVTFLDGQDMQRPLIIGSLPGYPFEASQGKTFQDPNKVYPKQEFLNEPDANRLARNQKIDNTIVKKKEDEQITGVPLAISEPGTWKQPTIPYNAKYPFNHVFESESGNIEEFDDTPTAERYHLYHKSGTFTEIDASGNRVNKIVGNGYEIVERDGYVLIKGSCVINIAGNANISVGEDAFVETQGKINVVAHDNINIASKKNITFQAEEDIQFMCKDMVVEGRSINANLKKGVDILAGDNIDIQGTKTYIQSKTPTPKPANYETWSRFNPDNLMAVVEPPSRESELIMAVEGYSAYELQSVGLNANDPKFLPPIDLKTGEPIVPKKITPISVPGVPQKSVTTETSNCGDKNTIISSYHKISDVLFPASGGSIQAQHGLTVCQIVTNMKKVGANIINPIFDKYGHQNCRLTSFFRKDGNPYSMANKTSKHELGLAVDIQFTDISGYKKYKERAEEIASIIYAELILVEINDKGSIWIHIQLPRGASA